MENHDKTVANNVPNSTLTWAKKLRAIAQTGLAFSKDHYDIECYRAVEEIAVEMITRLFTSISPDLADKFTCEAGYATPKVDVRAAVFSEKRLLLVRQLSDGYWTLPGGWADVGDSPSLAAVRQVKEKCGYDVVVHKLAAVYDGDSPRHGHTPIPYHSYKIFFLCEIAGGATTRSRETDGVSFFAEDCIPPLSVETVTPQQIVRLFEYYRHPDWPTSFD
jgi:ADP-ribose pyrophosphatase YjhB (NUDIX family)